MMQLKGQSSWQRPAQQPQAQQEAPKAEVPQPGVQQEAMEEFHDCREEPEERLTERQVYASIKRKQRELERKQCKLEAGNRRKVKKTTITKRPQQGAQPKREGGKLEEKSSAAQASSGEDGVLEMGALAVGQAKSEEQLTAYGGGQSEVQRLMAEHFLELEKQRQEHEAEVAALQSKLAAAQEASSRLVVAEAQLQDAQVASKEALEKAAELESELAAMKESADSKIEKVQAASWKREAATRAKLEQLQQEMDGVRESRAQAEANVVKKDKQLAQLKEHMDDVMQQLAEDGSDCWEDADCQWVKCVCLKLGDIQRQLRQQEC